MASAGNRVVVWEFSENVRWIPYEPNVTRFIEQQLASGANAARLGEVDPSLNDYAIDLDNMEQIEHVSGASTQNRVPIQRSIYPSDSPAAIGIMWQWSKHGKWKAYDMETASILEKGYLRRPSAWVDLSLANRGFPYIVDFNKWKQTNISTKCKRDVQRLKVGLYPKFTKNVKASPGVAVRVSSGAASTGYKSSSSALPPKTIKHSTSTTNSLGATGGMAKRSAGTVGLSGAQGRSTRKKKSSSTCSHMQPASHHHEPTQQNDCDIHKILEKYSSTVKELPHDEECCICCEKLSVASGYTDSDHSPIVIELKKCKHMFHQACLYAMYKTGVKDCSMQCPICKTIYGQKMGCCPDGTMNIYTVSQSLPGHHGCDTIVIEYSFRPGQQDSRHPHPGHRYYAMGFPRHCFLPNNKDGKKILKLLTKAWDRKLTFTIGTSVTTGQQDTVVWNEIHHKTEFGSNISGHGYPDPNYVKNVLAELAAQGITEDSDDSG